MLELPRATIRAIETPKDPKRFGKKNYFFDLFNFSSSYGNNSYDKRTISGSP
jgi:hypothetical protein